MNYREKLRALGETGASCHILLKWIFLIVGLLFENEVLYRHVL